ncbi:MAG TPA: amidase [Phycisphaerae bacterium]|nr:amidase [Phycisphaerae bacterium]
MIDPIHSLSLRTIAGRLEDGTLTARAVTEATFERHDAALDAYVTWTPDFARRQAAAADAAFTAGTRLGGLQGIPLSLKDLYGVAGLPTYAGSPRQLPPDWSTEGPVVTLLRRQLAVIVGKTHTVEFAFGGLGTSGHHPVPRNPRDPATHRAPGGSSSGAGVSVVEGTALVAFGTDTGGSVRIPASLTGTVGLKTTLGRWSTDGIVPLSPSFDTPGILTRSVADAAHAFECIDGATVPRSDHGTELRIGIAEPFFWSDTSPGVAERVCEVLPLLEADGAVLVDQPLPGAAEVFELYRLGGIVSAELYTFLRSTLPDWLDTLDPRVKRRMDDGKALEAWEFLNRTARYNHLARNAAALLAPFDAVISPTVPLTPPRVSDLKQDDTYARLNLLMLRNTCVVSFLGLCAVTLPVGLDAAGMPAGLQLIGAPRTETKLLAIARRIETLLARRDIWRPPHTLD